MEWYKANSTIEKFLSTKYKYSWVHVKQGDVIDNNKDFHEAMNFAANLAMEFSFLEIFETYHLLWMDPTSYFARMTTENGLPHPTFLTNQLTKPDANTYMKKE